MYSTPTVSKVTTIKDSYFVTYGVFYSMGILTFVPHQFIILATDYWMFKFRDPWHTGRPIPRPTPPGFPHVDHFIPEEKESGPAKERTPLQASFTSSFLITSQVSLLVFLIATALFYKKMPPPPTRIKGALFAMLVLFLINTAFCKINTDSFQQLFFAIVMILAVLLNFSRAVAMVSLFQLVTKFPLNYYGTILSGQAICGIMSSIIQISTLSMRVHSLTSGLIFFGFGLLLILFTTVFYLITKKKSKYFIYKIGEYEGTVSNTTDTAESKTFFLYKLKTALEQTKWFLGAMVFVQGSTAMVFPGLAALIVSVNKDDGIEDDWNSIFFVPVITFLGFNLFDFIGREVARKFQRPKNAFVILTLASLRLILVPLLMLCNAQPRKHMPVIFGDNYYIVLICIFAFTQGYLVNLCIISVPRVTRKEDLEFVTVLVPLFSVLSVSLCSAFNLVIISLL